MATRPQKIIPASDNIKELSDYEHARLPGVTMYLGSRDVTVEPLINTVDDKLARVDVEFVPALATGFREILDNAIDELVGHKNGNKIWVSYNALTYEICIEDNGSGIPLDKVQAVFTKARAGRNFEERGEVAGTNGIGASAVNFTSEYFIVDVKREGVHYHQEFRESPWNTAEQDISKPIKKTIGRGKGTSVRYKPSTKVYPTLLLPEQYVHSRMQEVAFLYPHITFYYNGTKVDSKALFNGYKPIELVFDRPKDHFKTTIYLIPEFHQEKIDHAHAVVNGICAYKGGEHIKTFRNWFFNYLLDELKPESRKRKLMPNRDDVAGGLLIFAMTTMKAPVFDSQVKTFAVGKDLPRWIKEGLDEAMFKGLIRKNPAWIDAIYQRTEDRTTMKDARDAEKENKKLKKKKVAKLTDATGTDRSKCILFIAEGDSALNIAGSARNEKVHAILPLRGKIMNVSGETAASVLGNEAVSDMLAAIGLEYGKKADRSKLRYGQLMIATDEDHDGYHILCLLVNLLFTYWPELFEGKPFVSKLKTPYLILKKGDKREYIYADKYDQFDGSKWKGWHITRAKGLGSLEFEDWVSVYDKPNFDHIMDDGSLRDTLDLLFNKKRADDRKIWLEIEE